MPIQITTQPALLSWDTQRARLDQSGNGAMALDISTQKPLLEMRTVQPKIQIDQTASFADAGLKNIEAFMSESISYGRQMLSAGISRIVDQGNEFVNIHTGVDPMPDQAIYNAYEMFEKSFNYGAIPQSRPNISLNAGQVDVNLNRGSVSNNSAPIKVDMSYTPWQVNYFMKQYNSISFRVESSEFKFSV